MSIHHSIPGLIALVLAALMQPACTAYTARNPSFPLDISTARHELDAMSAAPRPLDRPVVIAAGWLDPGVSAKPIRTALLRISQEPQIIDVTFPGGATFDDCRERLIDAVNRQWPCDDPQQTTEVDVIAISMGGVVARYAAMPRTDGRRLRIARLFTIASPHRGAKMARLPAWSSLHRDMRADSAFMRRLNGPDECRDFPIYPYVRLCDGVVGESFASPDDQPPWWVPARVWVPSHYGSAWDPRILADVSRRLRGEEPYTLEPRSPIPY